MPHIDAPTIVEHRAQQEQALLDAAEALLTESGVDALTFGALGERAGLARNSVYRYFSSRDDIIAAVCERELPQWQQQTADAMAAAEGLDAKLAAFVSTQLNLVAAGHHRLAQVLGGAPLGPAVRARINALAYRPAELLEPVLAAEGRPDPGMSAQLVQGIVNAGVRLLHSEQDRAAVEAATIAHVQRAVG